MVRAINGHEPLEPAGQLWLELKETKQLRQDLGLSLSDLGLLPSSVVEQLVAVDDAWNKELKKHVD